MTRIALLLLAVAGCAAPQHNVTVEPVGAYAVDALVVARQSLSRVLPSSLASDLPCEVNARLDARDMGRAAANFDRVAPSRIRIEVDLRADCGGDLFRSTAIHEVPAGPSPSERRAALAEGVQAACRVAAYRLRADD